MFLQPIRLHERFRMRVLCWVSSHRNKNFRLLSLPGKRFSLRDAVMMAVLMSAYIARQARRREQLLKRAPALLRLLLGAAAFLDVTAHHVFAKIVVDDVAAVFL